jgi:hypothetical protein
MKIRTLSAVLSVGGACAVLAACGSGSADQAAYCSSVTDFKGAVSGLADVKLVENGVSSLTTAVDKVETSGKRLVSDAKSEFSSESDALGASITALTTTVDELQSSADKKAVIAAVPAEIKAVQESFNTLSSAVKSKCE